MSNLYSNEAFSSNYPNSLRDKPGRYDNPKTTEVDSIYTPSLTSPSTSIPSKQHFMLVLEKANEALHKSSMITGSKVNTLAVPTDRDNIDQNLRKNDNYLDRPDDIIKSKRAFEISERPSINPLSEVPSTPHQNYSIGDYTSKLPLSRYADTQNFLSRVDEVIKKSVQVTSGYANPDPRATQPLNSHVINELRRSQEIKNWQNIINNTPLLRKEEYAPEKIMSLEEHPTYTNVKEDNQYLSPRVNEIFANALRKSQELKQRVEEMKRSEVLATIDSKNSPNTMESSLVLEKTTTRRSPKREVERPTTGGRPTTGPGMQINRENKIRPKFVEEYYEDGTIYRGDKIRSTRVGRGEFHYADGRVYEGEWENDRKNGYGILKYPNGDIMYDGEWKDDEFHGNGVLINQRSSEDPNFTYQNFDTLINGWISYEGEFFGGRKHGLGTLTLVNGQKFIGKFRYDKVHGVGTFNRRDGATISGEWRENQFVGSL